MFVANDPVGRRSKVLEARLRAAGFRPQGTDQDEQPPEVWHRDGWEAQLTRAGIEIRRPGRSEWTSVRDELAMLMPLAGRYEPRDWGEALYQWLRPWAHTAKTALQMIIGVAAAVVIVRSAMQHDGFPDVAATTDKIAAALAVSAAIELAYTLFTPGPDEAIDPLMLGLSSGLLIISAKLHERPVPLGVALLLGVVGLGVLFAIRHRFINDE